MRHYATVCHEKQLPVLLESMRRHCGDFLLHVLLWDWSPRDPFQKNVKFHGRQGFLQRHSELTPECLPGPPRRAIDIIDTMRWQFYADVMSETLMPLTAVDGDIWFWSSPEEMYREIGAAKMAVCPHRIPPAARGLPGVTFETHAKYGLYNSGFVYLNDLSAVLEMASLNREWSYGEVKELPNGRIAFGDQGWLEMVAHARGAHVIQHPGVNLAPWNVHQYGLLKAADGVFVVVNSEEMWPLVAYHYSSLRKIATPTGEIIQAAFPEYKLTPHQAQILYDPYVKALGWT